MQHAAQIKMHSTLPNTLQSKIHSAWRFAVTLSCAVLLSSPVVCNATAKNNPAQDIGEQIQHVKIGVAGPLTGPEAHYGRDFQNGIILATQHFNERHPKIAGRTVQIDLEIEDDQANPLKAKLVAQKLIGNGIKGILGHFNSGTTLPASYDYSQAGIPQIAMATAAKYTQQGYETTFRMMTSDVQQGQVAGRYAVNQLGFKRIAVVDNRTAYGQGLADEFAKAAQKAGAKIVAREFTSDQADNFTAILTRFKSYQPQAIFYSGTDRQAASMVTQMRKLGLQAAFITGDMAKTPAFLKIAGTAAEGSIVSLAGQPIEAMPGGKKFIEQYQAEFHEEVQVYAPYAYDGAMALFEAMVNANSTEPAHYLPFLKKIKQAGVTTKHLMYDKFGNLKEARVTLYKVVHGQWKTLASETTEF